jgi:hypothetical protein
MTLPDFASYGVVDIGPFKADIKRDNGQWKFRPYYTNHPTDTAAVTMNMLIRQIGRRVWTEVPAGEVPTLERVLRKLGRLK